MVLHRVLGSIARGDVKPLLSVTVALAVLAGPAAAESSLSSGAVPAAAAAQDSVETELTGKTGGDAQYEALFQSWKKLDALKQGVISIPSTKPVENVSFTSDFGVRTDPFRGVAAMHAGIDLAGPAGTPIYATADGVVQRAERFGGYGNLIELDHGKGIHTRFGHLSRILVTENTRVHRGQLIGLMGSTGRSTGSHLHYEVRIDGRAVNPLPYLQSADYVTAMQSRVAQAQLAQGGPDDAGELASD